MLGNSTVQSFLASLAGQTPDSAELFTLTLSGGSVYRYTSADVDLVVGGNTYRHGGSLTAYPVLQRGQIQWQTGLEVSTMELDFFVQPETLLGATVFAAAAAAGALRGATLLVERLIMSTWGVQVGTVWLFTGDLGEVVVDLTKVHATVDSAVKRLARVTPRRTFTPDQFPFVPRPESLMVK